MADTPLVAVLAAGRGARFGGGKLDALCAGMCLGSWALRSVERARLAPGIIVTGPDVPAFARAATGWSLLANPHPERGLGTSLAVAAGGAARRGAASLLVLLADMPLIPPELVRTIAMAEPPAAVMHGNRRGVPALFGSDMLPVLRGREGEGGASSILAALRGVIEIQAPVDSLLDVDTTDDLARAHELLAYRSEA